jgi:hypothetical protein
MAMARGRAPSAPVRFADAYEGLAAVLQGSVRHAIVDALLADGSPKAALGRLRKAMRTHTFPAKPAPLALRRIVETLDSRSRREGLHVLEGWDYREQRFPDDIAPVLLLDYCAHAGIGAGTERDALALLLDQYLLSVLSLVAVRAWDDGDPNANLDAVSGLLTELQGPRGSAHRFVDDAETLLVLAIAYYNPEEPSFDLLLRKVESLDAAHRLRVALPCAAVLGGHLRWGLRFMYRRDVGRMRADNVVDYPWLLFSVLTPIHEYARLVEARADAAARDAVVEGLLNGLSADPWAFTANKVPPALASHADEHAEVRGTLLRLRGDLLADFERHRPTPAVFSPLAFSCNFLSNAAVAMVVTALADGPAHPSLNALFTREREGVVPQESAARLAQRLMDYSAADPARLGAHGAPLIVHDPYDAVSAFNAVVRTLSEA